MACCGKIGEILEKIIDAIAPILAIALVLAAAYVLVFAAPGVTLGAFTGFTWLPVSIAGLSASTAAYVALGMAVMLDPDGAASLVGNAAGKMGEVAGKITAAAFGGVASGLTSGGVGAFLLYGGLAYLAYKWLFAHDDDEEREPTATKVGVATKDSDPKGLTASRA